jgi:hypothetical protein
MKSKLALVMMAAAGSAALAAAAQTQSQSGGDGQVRYFPSTSIATTKPAPSPEQDEPSGVTARATARNQSPYVGVGRAAGPARGGSYSVSTAYGAPAWVGRMNVSSEEASIGHEADQLAQQLAEARSDSDRDKLKVKLGEVLEKQFELRQKRHEGEIAELEAQVKKLKDLVARRQENRREIIARRLEQVLRESQGLGW